MTILYIVKNFPVYSQTFIINEIKSLINRGYKVDVFVWGGKRSLEGIENENLNVFYSIPDRKLSILDGVSAHAKSWKFLGSFYRTRVINKNMIGELLRLSLLTKLFKSKPYDIVQIHFGDMLEWYAQAIRVTGSSHKNVYATFHGFDAHLSSERYRNAVHLQDLTLFTNTNYIKKQVRALGFTGKVIQNFVGVDSYYVLDHKKERSISERNRIFLLSVARLIPRKGISNAIHVANILNEKGYDVHLSIVGDGPEMLNLQRLVNSLGINQLVNFHGKCTPLQVRTLLAKAHFFLFPCVTYNGEAEAQGVAPLEANGMCIPSFVFESGGVSEIIENGVNGYKYPENDYEQMANKILELIQNQEEYSKLCISSFNYVKERFMLAKSIDKIELAFRGG